MSRLQDLTGMRFSRLLVIRRSYNGSGGSISWECECDCGNKTRSFSSGLRQGRATSCGCLTRERFRDYGNSKKTHGMSSTKVDVARRHMISRCYRPSDCQYKNYGGRGISVCDRWVESLENFVEDMGIPPSQRHSLDRIDVNGNYEKSNCRWATSKEQQRNRTNNRMIEIDGETKTLSEWCDVFGVGYARTHKRIVGLGMDPIDAMTKEKLIPGPKNGSK